MANNPVVMTISHTLGREKATQRIKEGIEQFRHTTKLISIEQEHWSGSHLEFRLRALGQTCFGTLDIFDDSVRLDIVLTGVLGFAARSALSLAKKRAQTLLGASRPV